jgi:hypothetical protein
MKANKLAALVVTTYIGFGFTAHASAPQPVFSPEQEARIGEIAADYLVAHPEYWSRSARNFRNNRSNNRRCLHSA